MKIMEIIVYLMIFNFVVTGLSALSLLTGPSYVQPGSAFDSSQYDEVSASELIWSHISQNFLVSFGAGIVGGALANKLLNISGGTVLSISIFTGLLSSGLIGSASIFWNIYHTMSPSAKPAMGIGLYMFFGIVGILIAVSVMRILGTEVST